MESLKLSEIAAYCGAVLPDGFQDVTIAEISTDSRNIKPGTLFVPLVGERFDGHDFIDSARIAGAVAFLSSQSASGPDTLYVEDTLTALQDIAKGYRDRFNIDIVAVTGSVGKTTTKEMIAAVLSVERPTYKTEGNLNNLIGLPISILRMGAEHRAAVLEMGMSNFGEISRMSEVAQPNIAVITNIGVAHIEYLGTREGILKAKLEVLRGMSDSGCLILNGDEPLLYGMKGELGCRLVYFGINNPDADIKAENIRQSGFDTVFDLITPSGSCSITVPALGVHNVYNALASAAVALELNYSTASIAKGIAGFKTSGNRQMIYNRVGYTVVDDSYNANPESMGAALGVLKGMDAKGKKIAVLGDMLELGTHSEEAHHTLGKVAAKSADIVVLYGKESHHTAAGALESGMDAERVYHFMSQEELTEKLKEIAAEGSVMLFKGSRGMKMEKIIEMFFGGKSKCN